MCLTTSARSQQHPRCWRRQHPPCPAPSPPSTNSGATQHGCLPRQPPHPTPPGWGPCHGGGAVPHPRGGSICTVTAGRGCLDTLAYDHRQHEPKGQARGVVVESPPPGGPWVGRCPRRPRRCRPPWEPPLGGRPGDSACAQSGRQGGGGCPRVNRPTVSSMCHHKWGARRWAHHGGVWMILPPHRPACVPHQPVGRPSGRQSACDPPVPRPRTVAAKAS